MGPLVCTRNSIASLSLARADLKWRSLRGEKRTRRISRRTISGKPHLGPGAAGRGPELSTDIPTSSLLHQLQVVEGEGTLILAVALDQDGHDTLEAKPSGGAEASPLETQRLEHA